MRRIARHFREHIISYSKELAVKIIKILVCAALTVFAGLVVYAITVYALKADITGAKFKIAFIPLFTSNSATSCAWFAGTHITASSAFNCFTFPPTSAIS